MEGIFGDFLLSLGIKIFHKMEYLNLTENWAQKGYLTKFISVVVPRKTKKPLIVGIVGLIGSGKTTIAKEMASLIGATVVSGDDIRVSLREEKAGYDNTRLIAENVAIEVINKGGNVIIDSDFIDQKKRVSLKEKAKKIGARVIFIRIYADMDIMIGRIMDAEYKNIPEDFFGGASSSYQGKNKGAVVKERERVCRILSHYNAINIGNGRYKFELKKLPFKVFAEIDTSSENKWKQEVKMIAGQIRSRF